MPCFDCWLEIVEEGLTRFKFMLAFGGEVHPVLAPYIFHAARCAFIAWWQYTATNCNICSLLPLNVCHDLSCPMPVCWARALLRASCYTPPHSCISSGVKCWLQAFVPGHQKIVIGFLVCGITSGHGRSANEDPFQGAPIHWIGSAL